MQWWSCSVLPLWDGGGYQISSNIIKYQKLMKTAVMALSLANQWSTLMPTCNFKMVGFSYQMLSKSNVDSRHGNFISQWSTLVPTMQFQDGGLFYIIKHINETLSVHVERHINCDTSHQVQIKCIKLFSSPISIFLVCAPYPKSRIITIRS